MFKNTNSLETLLGKNKWKTLHEILFGNDKQWSLHRLVLYSSLCICLCFIGLMQEEDKPAKENFKDHLMTYDTLVPKDYALHPIEVENSEALDSFFGMQGVVDLYTRSSSGSNKLKLLVKNIKLVRAPKNPKAFSVLCLRSMTEKIHSDSGSFFVSIVNPKNSGTKFVNTKPKSNLEIDYL